MSQRATVVMTRYTYWLRHILPNYVVTPRASHLMKGPHPHGGSQAAGLTGLAHLYNLILYQRQAKNAGLCEVQVEGGRVPTSDGMLNLPILTSGG